MRVQVLNRKMWLLVWLALLQELLENKSYTKAKEIFNSLKNVFLKYFKLTRRGVGDGG